MNDSLADVSRQLALETKAHKEGQQRLIDRTDKGETKGRGSQTLAGGKLVKSALEACSSVISKKLCNTTRGPAGQHFALISNTIAGMDPEVLSVITLKILLDSLLIQDDPTRKNDRPNEVKTVAYAIGKAIQIEARLSFYREQGPQLYRAIEKSWKKHGHKSVANSVTEMSRAMNKKGHSWDKWSPSQVCKLGQLMLGWVAEGTGGRWFTIDKVQLAKTNRVTYVNLTDEMIGLRDSIMTRALELAYIPWPMVCKPNDWSTDQRGGYLTAEARMQPLVKGFGCNKPQGELPIQMINNLQSVAYRINRPVFDVAQQCFDQWMDVGSFHRKAATKVESWLAEDATREEIRDYRRYRKAVEDANCKLNSKNWQTTETVHVANMFKDEAKFYLPWNFDYRGRIYSICTSLQPQGTDFQKSLFYFAEEGPVNADWLYWHAGTTWGLDKKTHAERIAWAKDQHEMFTIIASDPFEALPIWSKADEPWMFLAAALEIHTCLIAKTKATSGLPIGVDATCSGLQHLSALTLNRDAAYQVNVVPTPEPSDGYRTVAEKAREYLPKEVGEWIDRKVTKRTVMTLPYGVQLKSARQYIYLALQEAGHTDEELKPFEGDIVDAIFNKAVPAVFPGPMSVMRWLKDSAAVVLKRGVKEICWRTPSGFVVQQIRDNKETDIISTKIMGSVRKMSVVKEGGDHKPSLKKHKQSISPNFIHSLDASLLHFMFSQWSKPFTAIHDCVLARSCDMDEMQSEIRLHFAEMYKGDPLNDWAKQLGLEVPDGMIIGDLDLDQVNHSHYFFC